MKRIVAVITAVVVVLGYFNSYAGEETVLAEESSMIGFDNKDYRAEGTQMANRLIEKVVQHSCVINAQKEGRKINVMLKMGVEHVSDKLIRLIVRAVSSEC